MEERQTIYEVHNPGTWPTKRLDFIWKIIELSSSCMPLRGLWYILHLIGSRGVGLGGIRYAVSPHLIPSTKTASCLPSYYTLHGVCFLLVFFIPGVQSKKQESIHTGQLLSSAKGDKFSNTRRRTFYLLELSRAR